MNRSVVMDVCTILHAPVYRPLLLIYMCRRAGVEVVCRSYLGRSTTKKLMAKVGLLPIIDDFLWNDAISPANSYEVSSPDDELLNMVGAELTNRLNYVGRATSTTCLQEQS